MLLEQQFSGVYRCSHRVRGSIWRSIQIHDGSSSHDSLIVLTIPLAFGALVHHVGRCDFITILRRPAILPMLLHVLLTHRLTAPVALDRLVRANEEVRVGKRPAAQTVLALVVKKVMVVLLVVHVLVLMLSVVVLQQVAVRVVASVELVVKFDVAAVFVRALNFELLEKGHKIADTHDPLQSHIVAKARECVFHCFDMGGPFLEAWVAAGSFAVHADVVHGVG